MKTKILTLGLAVLASMSLLKAEIYSGTCGDEATWSFNSATATLTISGSGSMTDSYEEPGPWCRYDFNIVESTKHVVIEEGITRIGKWNFYYHQNLQTVEIASTVTYIENLAFAESNNIQSVTCKGQIAPYYGEMCFTKVFPILYVPAGFISAYEAWAELCEEILEDNHKIVRTQLPDTTVCQGERVAIGDTEGQIFYRSGSISYTYAVSDELDSIVWRNVNVRQLITPYISIRNEEGSLHSGCIYIYDNYYYSSPEYTTHASYDYFTVNGVRYDHSPNPNENAVEIAGGSVYGSTSYFFNNLSQGTYQIAFYLEDCNQSYSENYTIVRKHIYVDGLYYNFDYTSEWDDVTDTYYKKYYATVTYKGIDYNYSNYSDSKIVIPEQITVEDTAYTVKRIDSYAFYQCRYLNSVTIPATIERINDYAFNSCSNLNEIILYPKTAPYIYDSYVFRGIASDARFLVSIGAYSSYSGSYYWSSLNLQPAVTVNAEVGPTNCTLTFEGLMDEITACGVKDGEKSEGNTIEYVGLEPNSTYSNVEFVVYNEDNASAVLTHTFQTSALELTTLESKAASSTTAILLAETNIDASETNCGFEWKRYEAPSDMNPTKVYATVQNGIMAGRLKGLKDDVYYQYRAFYESASGKIYRGAWQYIFTGDAGVEFEPILYTEPAHIVRENEAILRGFALAGSEEITEQGFEYWVEKRVNIAQEESENGSRNMPADIHGQRHLIQAEGVSMEATITDLDAGTLYKFRVYAKAGGVVYYGGEQSFITYGVYEGEDAYTAVENIENQETATKILRDGQILILRDGKTYTVTGQVVK
jgi:hypothetical protein